MSRQNRCNGFLGRSVLYALVSYLLIFQTSSYADYTDTYTKTRHPIVLIHGLSGFDDILGVSYWYRIPQALREGGAEVYVLQVSAFNATEVRGEQAARQIEMLLATTGAEKVNIIGHSHGGPTSRYVASVYPQYVASVTSVGGVNWGTPIADLADQVQNLPPFLNLVAAGAANALGRFLDFLSGGHLPQNSSAAIHSLSTAETLKFNARYPEGVPAEYCGEGTELESNGVYYFSFTGSRLLTNYRDISDVFMLATGQFIDEANDGLVPACSAHLGAVLRDNYRMNHLDEVDQLFGLHSSRETDPPEVYRQLANRLQLLGL